MSELYERATQYGTTHLNAFFVGKGRSRRLWKGSGTRIDGTDIFWMVVFTIPSFLILALIVWLASFSEFLSAFLTPAILFVSPAGGVVFGIVLSAKITPYKKHSGEGILDFIKVNQRNLREAIVWRLNGQTTMYGEEQSKVDGKYKIERVRYWQGSARAQRKVLQSPYTKNQIVRVQLDPISVQTTWKSDIADKEMRREQQRRKVIGS